MDVRTQALWDRDPSPSWNAIAAKAGIDPPMTSPDEPASDVEWQLQAFWPLNAIADEGRGDAE